MARVRLGVMLCLPEPYATEVNGLRRALGVKDLSRIAPHITLVPPVNVQVDEVPAAKEIVADGAAGTGPLDLHIGPPGTFAPVNPVVYLEVGGATSEMDHLRALRAAVLSGPLERHVGRPFVPHVTLNDRMPPQDIPAALSVAGAYEVDLTFEQLHLMQESQGGVWRPIFSVPFGSRRIRARGPLAITVETLCSIPEELVGLGVQRSWMFLARRQGVVAGVAQVHLVNSAHIAISDAAEESSLVLDHIEVLESERLGGIGSALVSAVADHARALGGRELMFVLRADRGQISSDLLAFATRHGFNVVTNVESNCIMKLLLAI